MQTVFNHLKEMRNLQVLMPFLLLGWAVVIFAFSPWMLLAILWGALLQFLFEYILHRFAYHGPPPTDRGRSQLYRTHLAHHEFPGDPRFFAGDAPWFGVRVAAIVVLHTLALWPLVGLDLAARLACSAIFVGGIGAYIFYEYCHTLGAPEHSQGAVRHMGHPHPPRPPFSGPPRDLPRQRGHGLDRPVAGHGF